MDKREIYEHLAKIYLDASNKYKKKKKKQREFYLQRYLFVIALFFILGLGINLTYLFRQKQKKPIETNLVLVDTATKINFNFNPAKKETLTINLKGLNLSNFKELRFSAKNTSRKNLVSLRVELTNSFKEKSEVYIRNIPSKWQEFKISFLDFQKITDWSRMQDVSFVVEEWNASEDKGIVYLDNVRFVK